MSYVVGVSIDADDRVTDEMATLTAPVRRVAFLVRPVEGSDARKAMHVGASSGRMTVGTSTSCELVLSDRSVSRRHVAFDLSGLRLRVTDLDSTNGTTIKGVGVREGFASVGDAVTIGAPVLTISEDAANDARLPSRPSLGRIVGASVAMMRLYPILERLAASTVAMLIEGEPGTGKELFAETVHELGPRSAAPFVVFDVSLVPAVEAERELLGGSDGAFHRARGGTLVIDAVEQLGTAAQARVTRELKSAGADAVRVIAITRTSLDKEVELGRFREDLYFELAVGRVDVPPLRSRGDDVRLLAEYFWKKLDTTGQPLPSLFLRRYEGHGWPGNVRELASAVARYLALGPLEDDDVVQHERAPLYAFRWVLDQSLAYPVARSLLLAEFERVFVTQTLADYKGNVSRAAAASGLARRYFQIMRARVEPK